MPNVGNSTKIYYYSKNCFLLLIPIIIWNIFLIDLLPETYSRNVFWNNIPFLLLLSENLLKIIVFVFPLFLKISVDTKSNKYGFVFYFIGIIIYFLSWILQIYFPFSFWSQSFIGYSALAFTPIIWLMGIGLIGNQSFLRNKNVSNIYIIFSVVFVFVHTYHSYLVFSRF